MQPLIKEQKGQSEWSTVYLLIIFAIAALLLIGLIKPIFQNAQQAAKAQPLMNNP